MQTGTETSKRKRLGVYRRGMYGRLFGAIASIVSLIGVLWFIQYVSETMHEKGVSLLLTVVLLIPAMVLSIGLIVLTHHLLRDVYERSYWGTRNYLWNKRKKFISMKDVEERLHEENSWKEGVQSAVSSGHLNQNEANRILKKHEKSVNK